MRLSRGGAARTARMLMLVSVAPVVAVLALAPLPNLWLARLSWAASVMFTLATLLGARSTVRGLQARDPARRFWGAIGFNAGSVAVAYVAQLATTRSTSQLVAGPVVQVMVAVGALAMVAVMLTYPLRIASARDRFCFWLDMATVMVAAAAFGWYLSDPGGEVGTEVLALLTGPVIMLVAVFAVAKLLVAGRPPFSLTPGLLGVGAAMVAAVLAAFGEPLLQQDRDGLYYALSALGDALMMIAAWTQSRQVRRRPDVLERRRRSYSTLPYMALAGTFVLLSVALHDTGLQGRTWAVLAGTACSVGLVVVRQLASFADNERLLAELDVRVRAQHRTEGVLRAALEERDALAQRLSVMAFYDSLTGLGNRSMFHDRLAGELDRSPGDDSDVTVLYLDLDDFKPINDRYGHQAGDEVLREVAGRLLACVRASDTVCRLGGDEFAVILHGRVPEGAREVAGRIIAAVSEPCWFDGMPLTVGVSIGLAMQRADGCDADQLLGLADAAMYQAKGDGKNSVYVVAGEGAPERHARPRDVRLPLR